MVVRRRSVAPPGVVSVDNSDHSPSRARRSPANKQLATAQRGTQRTYQARRRTTTSGSTLTTFAPLISGRPRHTSGTYSFAASGLVYALIADIRASPTEPTASDGRSAKH